MEQFDTIVHGTYDLRLVALSYIVAVIASYAALDLAGRVTVARGNARYIWLGGGAVAMGLGIWTMHFTGMLALHISMPISYDAPIVAVSLLIAIGASGFALFTASQPTLALRPLLLGGLLMGSGIAAMHYTGMAAMNFDGAIQYHPGWLALSILIAISASVAALWLAFNLRIAHTRPRVWAALKFGSACIMGAAITGMHYTGMAAARFLITHTTPMMVSPDSNVAMFGLALSVATLIILGFVLLSSVVDRRFSAQAATFESLFFHSTDAIFALDLDGKLRRANPAAARLVEGKLPERPLDTLIGADDAERLRAQVQRAARGTPDRGEFMIASEAGQPLIGQVTSAPIIIGEQIIGVYAIIRDITARHQAEDALRQQRDLYKRLLYGLSDLGEGVVVIENQRITFANDAFCRLCGYTQEELLALDLDAGADRSRGPRGGGPACEAAP